MVSWKINEIDEIALNFFLLKIDSKFGCLELKIGICYFNFSKQNLFESIEFSITF